MDFNYGKRRADAGAATECLLAVDGEIKARTDQVEAFVTLHRLGIMGEPNHVHGPIDGGQA